MPTIFNLMILAAQTLFGYIAIKRIIRFHLTFFSFHSKEAGLALSRMIVTGCAGQIIFFTTQVFLLCYFDNIGLKHAVTIAGLILLVMVIVTDQLVSYSFKHTNFFSFRLVNEQRFI